MTQVNAHLATELIKLNDGHTIPAVGMGVYQAEPGPETKDAVCGCGCERLHITIHGKVTMAKVQIYYCTRVVQSVCWMPFAIWRSRSHHIVGDRFFLTFLSQTPPS